MPKRSRVEGRSDVALQSRIPAWARGGLWEWLSSHTGGELLRLVEGLEVLTELLRHQAQREPSERTGDGAEES